MVPLNGAEIRLLAIRASVSASSALARGATMVYLPRFTPQDAFALMHHHKVTVFAGGAWALRTVLPAALSVQWKATLAAFAMSRSPGFLSRNSRPTALARGGPARR